MSISDWSSDVCSSDLAPGVLILSRVAGAALQLKQALLVNPYSAEEVSDAILRALEMPLEERKQRWRAMMDNIAEQDVGWWRARFVALLDPEEVATNPRRDRKSTRLNSSH